MLLNLAGPAPLLKRDQLVVMHDVTPARFPRTFSRRFVLWYSVLYRVLARRARHLATVSEFSRGELGRGARASIPRGSRSRRTVTSTRSRPAPTPPSSRSAPTSPPAPSTTTCCASAPSPRARTSRPVTRALAAAGIPVVVVGAAGARRVFAEEIPLDGPGIHLAGRLSDGELALLLRNARALVFPSLYEGFGLPLVEAQALDCPVVASDRASIPEVAGEGALYFDPMRPEDAVARVRELVPAERRRLISHGRPQRRALLVGPDRRHPARPRDRRPGRGRAHGPAGSLGGAP